MFADSRYWVRTRLLHFHAPKVEMRHQPLRPRGDDDEHRAYGAAKGGLLALTKGIARGSAREDILAYAAAPAWAATDITGADYVR